MPFKNLWELPTVVVLMIMFVLVAIACAAAPVVVVCAANVFSLSNKRLAQVIKVRSMLQNGERVKKTYMWGSIAI